MRLSLHEVFQYTIVSADGDELGAMTFTREYAQGDLISSGIGRLLRVLDVVEPERDDQLPALVVELAE